MMYAFHSSQLLFLLWNSSFFHCHKLHTHIPNCCKSPDYQLECSTYLQVRPPDRPSVHLHGLGRISLFSFSAGTERRNATQKTSFEHEERTFQESCLFFRQEYNLINFTKTTTTTIQHTFIPWHTDMHSILSLDALSLPPFTGWFESWITYRTNGRKLSLFECCCCCWMDKCGAVFFFECHGQNGRMKCEMKKIKPVQKCQFVRISLRIGRNFVTVR